MIRVFCLAAVGLLACSCLAEEPTEAGMTRADVVRVVDGDTIVVEIGGEEERVRYIGIDTPESVQPNQPVECFGPEASDANASLVEGETVFLQRDISDRDRFGRLLRYVYVEDDDGGRELVNLELVRNGYAEAVGYAPDLAREDDLDRAERAARAEMLGMWGACEGITSSADTFQEAVLSYAFVTPRAVAKALEVSED